MPILYHFPLSPASRLVRIVLGEKAVEFAAEIVREWDRDADFLALNPAGELPVLVEDDGTVLADGVAIAEYLDETHPDRHLVGFDPPSRAETRRLVNWFHVKFAAEVSDLLLEEKLIRRLSRLGQPDSTAIRAAQHNIRYHLDYIGYLTERRHYLAGKEFGLADVAAAAHISCIDYFSDVPWDAFGPAREWYARIKSRPSFRTLLADHIPGLPPPKHYADLDF